MLGKLIGALAGERIAQKLADMLAKLVVVRPDLGALVCHHVR